MTYCGLSLHEVFVFQIGFMKYVHSGNESVSKVKKYIHLLYIDIHPHTYMYIFMHEEHVLIFMYNFQI